MKNEFICLAKSQKYNGRCVAGILLGRNEGNNSLYIKRDDSGNPQWIRPVGPSVHGEIEDAIGSQLELLSVYEIDEVVPCADRYQSENVNYKHPHYKKTTRIGRDTNNLDKCCDKSTSSVLFVNRGKAIPEEHIDKLDHSIKLIKVSSCSVHIKDRDNRSDQYRMKFDYNGKEYDLPMTDLDFRETYIADDQIFAKHEQCYVSVSIGIGYEGWYYKLVASVILL